MGKSWMDDELVLGAQKHADLGQPSQKGPEFELS